MLAIQTILHPTDFSERSGYAFETALALARDYGARLLLLHVTTPPRDAPKDEYQRALQEKLRWLHPAESPVTVEARLVEGDAATEILHVAQDGPCDLIVMGTHGRKRASGQVIGSVAEKVIRNAPCPVIVVRVPFALAAAEAPARPEEAAVAR